MANFSPELPHEENMKVSIDKILGSDTVLKRQKKTAEDHKKAIFINLIEDLSSIEHRSNEMLHIFDIDMDQYEAPFYSAFDNLFSLVYNKAQINLIYFYLYERIGSEGEVSDLIDDTGKSLGLTTAEKLYEQVKKHK